MEGGMSQQNGLVRCTLFTINENPEEAYGKDVENHKSSHKEVKGCTDHCRSLEVISAGVIYEEVLGTGMMADKEEEIRNPEEASVEVVKSSLDKEEPLVTEKQRLPTIRQSERVQEQLIKKYQAKSQDDGKKEAQEGNSSYHNSFSVLDNDKIVSLAAGMGVVIPSDNFDTIDIMKDLEKARQALNKIKNIPCVEESKDLCPMDEIQLNDIPLLDWYENDSEAKHFTLVQSRKKKKRKSLLKNLGRENHVRRSKRTAPMYRSRGEQENPAPTKGKTKKVCPMIRGIFRI
jgi:hypothetical protein